MECYSTTEKKDYPAIRNNMDESGGHNTKWNKPVRQILHSNIYLWNLKKKKKKI